MVTIESIKTADSCRMAVFLMILTLIPICQAEPWSFAVVSDTYGGLEWSLKESMVHAHEEDGTIKFIIASGDITAGPLVDGYFDSYLLDYYQGQSHVPWMQSVGNHNAEDDSYLDFIAQTLGPRFEDTPGITNLRQGPSDDSLPNAQEYTTFSFDYENAHFVFYNQYYGEGNWDDGGCIYDIVLEWVEDDLEDTDKPIKFVIGHEPAFPCQPEVNRHCGDSLENTRCPDNGQNTNDPSRPARDEFWDVLNDNRVAAHFVGHTHQFCARAVKSLDDFPGISCSNGECTCASWNCYCDNEQELAQISNGDGLTNDDGVIEFNTGITGTDGNYGIITIDGDTVTFSAYLDDGTDDYPLVKQFTYSVEAECDPDETEVCDDIDNDCDGDIDENDVCGECALDATEQRQCGDTDIGACEYGKETRYCESNGLGGGLWGEWGSCTGYLGPTIEICDNKDNDCDAETDENSICGECAPWATEQRQCGETDAGACQYGKETRKCISNGVGGGIWDTWSLCKGAINPAEEICLNNIDDDCDGQSDENCGECLPGNTETKQCGETDKGACEYGTQSRNCSSNGLGGGVWSTFGTCIGLIGPATEICDGKDNDCDGKYDEDSVCGTCTTGAIEQRQCGQTDAGACQYGKETRLCISNGVGGGIWDAWGSCTGAINPAAEICWNSIDDDCDRQVDEDCGACAPGQKETQQCGTSVGICEFGSQERTCGSGSQWGSWGSCTGGVNAGTELCDGKDNDCDGHTDEDNVCGTCTVGAIEQKTCGSTDIGACEYGKETRSCVSNGLGGGAWSAWSSCEGAVIAIAEACDNIDNDCDGSVDENLTILAANQQGLCSGNALICLNGIWTDIIDNYQPQEEIKDSLDNDCDGNVDEGFVKKSGGSSGGSSRKKCKEAWTCGNWSECSITGTQARDCIYTNKCKTSAQKPISEQNCEYKPIIVMSEPIDAPTADKANHANNITTVLVPDSDVQASPHSELEPVQNRIEETEAPASQTNELTGMVIQDSHGWSQSGKVILIMLSLIVVFAGIYFSKKNALAGKTQKLRNRRAVKHNI